MQDKHSWRVNNTSLLNAMVELKERWLAAACSGFFFSEFFFCLELTTAPPRLISLNLFLKENY
jgi:hypothetical protein